MICLVDLSGIFWRNYFGSKSDLDAYDITLNQVKEYDRAYEQTAVCCDCGPLLRKEWFPEYKATRDEKPEDALESLRAIEEQVQSWKTPLIKIRGYEADDIIATLVEQAWLDEVRIVSSDKDLYQLLSDSVRMITASGEVGPGDCVTKWGIRPEQMADFLTLAGDASDNIPGCPGVGIKKARDLLVKFGTLAAVKAATEEELAAIPRMGEKTIADLREWDPTMAARLVKLITTAPVKLEELWKDAA